MKTFINIAITVAILALIVVVAFICSGMFVLVGFGDSTIAAPMIWSCVAAFVLFVTHKILRIWRDEQEMEG